MDIRNHLDAVRSLLGVDATSAASVQPAKQAATASITALGTDQATLSSAGSTVLSTASGSDVRADKVAAIQSALAAGTYHVPASAVASKVVDSMLGKGN